jgi:hypothetical protein
MTLEVFLKSILDPTFCYTPSLNTDISKTFARIRREQRHGARIVAELYGVINKNVSPITRFESDRAVVPEREPVSASSAWRVMDSKKGYLTM